MLTRVAHRVPSIQGYPLIAFPFMIIALMMCAFVAGEVKILAKVYEIAFLGVMVSFCLGVVLQRNKALRKQCPRDYLSTWVLKTQNITIPVIPFLSGCILFIAQITLFFHSDSQERAMLLQLFSMILLVMAFYRWGVLEDRLENRSDLRLGTGKYSGMPSLPEDLNKYVLCTGGTGARHLINSAIRQIKKTSQNKEPFELVVIHAEDNHDQSGFFYELLQRVVSQQIVPIHQDMDMIIRVKIFPGSLVEALQTLRKTIDFNEVLIGGGRRSPTAAPSELESMLENELEVKVEHV
jgi:hypothetical protein